MALQSLTANQKRIQDMLLGSMLEMLTEAQSDVDLHTMQRDIAIDTVAALKEELRQLEYDATEFFRGTQAVHEPPPIGTLVYVPDDNRQKIPGRHPTGCAAKCTIVDDKYGKLITFRARDPGPIIYVNNRPHDDSRQYAAGDLLWFKVGGPSGAAVQELLNKKVGDEIVVTQELFTARLNELTGDKSELTSISTNRPGIANPVIIGNHGVPTCDFNVWSSYHNGALIHWEPIHGIIVDIQLLCRTQEVNSTADVNTDSDAVADVNTDSDAVVEKASTTATRLDNIFVDIVSKE